MSASISPRSSSAAVTSQPTLERRIGPLQATAINMTQMCGIGPFVTIPAMVATIGGPEAMFGWIIGAILALADGLIWANSAPPCRAPVVPTYTCGRRSSTAPDG